ncbi:unnamed protein product [Owenia fusiformis]|uniref:von Willebrand factor D and EGF domain-containing protein n=1 Tax=Owenia fusiformis TaxID=6347 RepID=A0A8S4NKU9_OWEFU|nr:unnamed protein product [Owenia fusiformis]
MVTMRRASPMLLLLLILLNVTLQCIGEELPLCSGKFRNKKKRSITSDFQRFRRSPLAKFDPCFDHITLQDDGRRSSKVKLEEDDLPVSDQDMTEGWYLLKSPAGNYISRDDRLDLRSCSTSYPIWLKEPKVDPLVGDVVQGIACQSSRTRYCAKEIPIHVKTCAPTGHINEPFVVYYLTAPTIDKAAYCIGDKARCAEGTGSITGFEPCRTGEFPKSLPDPVVNYRTHLCERDGDRTATYTAIVFTCAVNTHEQGINFDVWWYMDDQRVKEERNIPKHRMPAKLYEDEWIPIRAQGEKGMGQTIHCRVSGKYAEIGVAGPLKISQNLEIGFGIDVNTRVIRVTENQEKNKDTIIVRPRLPILCPPDVEDESECDLQIELRAPDYAKHNGKCSADDDNRQIVFPGHRCRKYIEYDSVNFNVKKNTLIDIQAVTDGRTDGDYDGIIKFDIRVHHNHPAWNYYKFPPIQITVVDETPNVVGKICRSNNDPHMKTFDGRRFEAHVPGEYVMYQNRKMSLQINGFYKKCRNTRSGPTCNCGIAVRAGRNVFIIDECAGNKQEIINGQPNPIFKSVRIGQLGCDNDILTVNRAGRTYTIKLPSGTKVTYNTNSIHITPTLNDWRSTEGLCGTLNGNIRDDFRKRDGSYVYNDDTPYIRAYNDVKMKEFAESWKVPKEDRRGLYNPDTYQLDPIQETVACGCEKNGGTDIINCGLFKENNICDTLDGDRQTIHYDNCRKKRSTTFHDFVDDFDEMSTFDVDSPAYDFRDEIVTPLEGEWRNGWTEESATLYCNELVASSRMTTMCIGLQNVHVDEAVDMCIIDIKISGDTIFAPTALDIIQTECKTEMGFNISLWTRDDSKNFTGPPTDIVETLCPSNCNLQGICINGKCECYEGLEGDDCTINSTAPPEAYNIPQRALCDLQRRPCLQTPVAGENFLESESLTCRIQFTTFNGSHFTPSGYIQKTKADYEHYQQIHCPLPNTRVKRRSLKTKESAAPRGYIVSVSNNKILYSLQELLLTVYDSKCHVCPETGKCTWKENICVIDGKCYDEGEFPQPGKTCLVCRPELSTSSWTKVGNTCLIDGDCFNHNEARFDANCLQCDTSVSETQWTMKDGTCYIKHGEGHRCANENESYPDQECAKCLPDLKATEWSIDDNSCFINSVCRQNGFIQPHASCSSCDSSKDKTTWTMTDGNCYIEGRCYIDGTKATPVSCLYCDASESTQKWSIQDGSCFIDGRCVNDTTTHSVDTCKECRAGESQNAWLTKVGSCFIDDLCYARGATNGRLSCMICDPNHSTSSWIQQSNTCLIDNNCYNDRQDSPHSTCLHCSPSDNAWVMKEGRCLINGFCYKKDETSPVDDCKICRPGESTDDWSFNSNSCSTVDQAPTTVKDGHSSGLPSDNPATSTNAIEASSPPSRDPTTTANDEQALIMAGGPCVAGDMFRDPADCSRYLMCNHGTFISMPCAPGTRFNNDLKVFDHAANVPCP